MSDSNISMRALPIPADMCGAVIGKNGVHIGNMIKHSGVDAMWVDTEEESNFNKKWCHVRMKGNPRALYIATLLVISTLTTTHE